MALKYKRILLKLSGEVLKGTSDSCHDETILAEVAQPFDAREAIRLMGQGTVALFAGDTGNPFFSTDSGADLRAAEIGADALLKATKVDGVYSADPAKDPTATRYEALTYQEALAKDLHVMDAAAFALCRDNNIPIVVFDFHAPDSLRRVVCGEPGLGTVVS